MEIVVVAFAFILEDFAELFVEYFCVEKYITGYDYEKETAQSFTAAVSSITLNLIGKVFIISRFYLLGLRPCMLVTRLKCC